MESQDISIDTPALKAALEAAGMSMRAASLRAGLGATAVKDIVNGKSASPEASTILALAKVLRVSPEHLMGQDGGELNERLKPDLPPETDARADLDGVVMLPEYDVRLSAGPGFVVDAETTRREWPYPRFLIVDTLGIQPARATVQEVIGDSMEPTLSSGDYVVIDMADARIGLPGIFAVWDGDALVCKRVERIPGTDPRKVMLRSDNPLHGAYEVAEEDVRIIGRVRWITRRA